MIQRLNKTVFPAKHEQLKNQHFPNAQRVKIIIL